MATTTCPYCWTVHRRADLMMRCGERCDHRGELFPERSLKEGRCPHGKQPQLRRACPNCGNELLREYVECGGRNIAVIGSSDSGKSTWVGVLVREFQRGQVHERFDGMTLNLLGERSRERYKKDFEIPLFEDSRPVLPTASAVRTTPEPLLFSMRFTRPGRFGSNRIEPVVTVFYDTAGEDVARAATLDQLIDYLESAEGIILLLDPMQMRGVRRLVGGSGAKTKFTEQLDVVTRLGEVLSERAKGRVGKLLKKPLAIALTKLDLLLPTFGPESPLRQPSRHIGVYDQSDGRDVHEEVRAWLDERYDPAFDRTVRSFFEVYQYFGLSALGAPPVSGTQLSPDGVHPYRLEDPMLWLLSRFGVIRTRGGR
jgi:GTPase SAR1 family protein